MCIFILLHCFLMEIGLYLHSISYLNENEEKVIYEVLAIQTID